MTNNILFGGGNGSSGIVVCFYASVRLVYAARWSGRVFCGTKLLTLARLLRTFVIKFLKRSHQVSIGAEERSFRGNGCRFLYCLSLSEAAPPWLEVRQTSMVTDGNLTSP